MKQRRNLLLVAYHFPPIGGSGVQRALKFAKYLPACGWRVHVLTAGHHHYPLSDGSLLEDLGEDVVVHRVNGWDAAGLAARAGRMLPLGAFEDRVYWRLDKLMSRWAVMESVKRWSQAAIRAAARIIPSQQIDAVVTTSPPHGVQQVGLSLKRRFGVPWLADLRDPIVDNFTNESGIDAKQFEREELEREIVECAERTIVTCDDLRMRLIQRHAGADVARVVTITNGFDEQDRPTRAGRQGNFVLGYVGSFYHDQSIAPILEAVRSFLELRPDALGRFELRVAGSIAVHQRCHIRESDGVFLREMGYRSHAEALQAVADSSALFLMTPANECGRYCIPAKTFEYLAFGGPILAVIHRATHLEKILGRAGNVTLVSHGDHAGLRTSLSALFDDWPQGIAQVGRNAGSVAEFRRDTLARLFACTLDTLIDGNVQRSIASDRPQRTEVSA